MMRMLKALPLIVFLTSCSNEMIVLHSKVKQSRTEGNFSSSFGTFPIAKNYTNFFTYADVEGEIDLNNQLKFDIKNDTFSLDSQDKHLKVNVALSQLRNEKTNYLLSDISGAIYLPNGRVIRPIRTYIEKSFSSRVVSVYDSRVPDASESYSVQVAPEKTCLVFEYQEIVNPDIKFILKLANLKAGNEHRELEFNFTPMVIKHTSH